jgi:hypothetical protein
LLNKNGIYLDCYERNDKNYTSTCPKCSLGRQRAHRKIKCLSVKIDDRARRGTAIIADGPDPRRATATAAGSLGRTTIATPLASSNSRR